MNPNVPQSLVDQAMERDPDSAASEWLAQFRTDVAAWITRSALAACVSPGVYERPPQSGDAIAPSSTRREAATTA